MKNALIILVLCLLSLNSYSAKKHVDYLQDSITEKKVYNKIESLPEIKKYVKRIDSLFKDEKHAAIIIVSKPSQKETYYWVEVGVDADGRFVPEYNFYVYPPKLTIKFFDTVNDSILDLREWRRKRKQK